jgi:hypothetical protein
MQNGCLHSLFSPLSTFCKVINLETINLTFPARFLPPRSEARKGSGTDCVYGKVDRICDSNGFHDERAAAVEGTVEI